MPFLFQGKPDNLHTGDRIHFIPKSQRFFVRRNKVAVQPSHKPDDASIVVEFIRHEEHFAMVCQLMADSAGRSIEGDPSNPRYPKKNGGEWIFDVV